jgi:murein L,D-transpeptidase YafK
MKHLFLPFGLLFVCASGFACQQQVGLARETTAKPGLNVEKKPEPAPEATLQKGPLKLPLKNPRILVMKSERRMDLYSDGKVVRTYRVGLGLNPVPDKKRRGDHATPEGDFYVFTRNNKSAFYLSLGISYPNVEDAARGLRDGLISRGEHDAIVKAINRKATPPQNTALGGDIYIHGNGSTSDWTWGCVALENAEMKELFDAIPVGTPVTIKP